MIAPSSQQTVSIVSTLNVTSNGEPLTDSLARSLDLGPRTLTKAVGGGRRGVATTSVGTDVVTNTPSVALGAAYTKAVNETIPHLPICVISYFVQTPGQCFYVPSPPIDNWSTLFARNTIGSFPYALDEIDSQNNTVARYNFALLEWPRTPLAASASDDDVLAVFEWKSPLRDGANVSVAFIQSAVVGVVNLAETPVLPKAWEVIIRVDGYKFLSSGNYLKLEYMMATGFGVNRRTPGLIVLSNPNSTLFDDAYCQMSNHTAVGLGNSTWVDVTPTTFNLVTTLDPPSLVPILNEQLTLEYGTFGIWRSNVSFPVGEGYITYQVRTAIGDPIVAGTTPTSNSTVSNTNASDASFIHTTSVALNLLLVLLIAFLF
jgi:hypothetical protein